MTLVLLTQLARKRMEEKTSVHMLLGCSDARWVDVHASPVTDLWMLPVRLTTPSSPNLPEGRNSIKFSLPSLRHSQFLLELVVLFPKRVISFIRSRLVPANTSTSTIPALVLSAATRSGAARHGAALHPTSERRRKANGEQDL